MKKVWFQVLVAGCVLLGASGCSSKFMRNFKANLSGDSYGNWEVRAARVPETGASCVARCKQADAACFQHLQDPGMNGNAQEMEQCYEQNYACYLGCRGATEVVNQVTDQTISEAMNAACRKDLPEGTRVYCMTRNGVIGQAFDP